MSDKATGLIRIWTLTSVTRIAINRSTHTVGDESVMTGLIRFDRNPIRDCRVGQIGDIKQKIRD